MQGIKKLTLRANDFGLIKNHAILKNMSLYKDLVHVDFVSFIRQS